MNFLYTPYIYKSPFGGVATSENVRIEFPIKYNIYPKSVTMIIRKYSGDTERICVPFDYTEIKDDYKIYVGEFSINEPGIYYYRFEMLCDDGIWFIGRNNKGQAIRGDFLPEWQLTVYQEGYKTPDFIKGGIIYHIFIDRFNTSGKVQFNKKGVLKSWDKDVTIHEPDGTYLANDFFGGNFQGIIDKLDYLEDLGVTLIYLSPIFKSFSNHRYDTGDYMQIDEMLGDEKTFKRLIDEAAKRKIFVMLDGVFNHTGADSIYFNKLGSYNSIGAYQSKDSPYYDWFYFDKHPDLYASWWGITVVPTINKSNSEYRKLLLGHGGILDKWTKMGVKGWRLDVVDELPEDLVNEIRDKVKSVDQDTLIIGEVWEDASVKVAYGTLRPYLTRPQLDGVMNYPFKEAIIRYIKQGSTDRFRESIMRICDHYPKQSLDVMMNVLGTHDTVRIINALSDLYATTKSERQLLMVEGEALKLAKARLKVATSILFTLPGVPSIYYGDEVGLQGFEDPLNRRPFPWGYEDEEILLHYKRLGQIRREHKHALTGSIKFIEHKYLSIYIRQTKGESIAVVTNISGKKRGFTSPVKGVNLITRQIIDKGIHEVDNLECLIISY